MTGHPHRLDPDRLRADAERLLAAHPDPVDLVASLLRSVRQNDDVQRGIRDGYAHTAAWFRTELEQVEQRAYLDALWIVRNMRPFPTTQVTYEGAKRQAARLLRRAARPLDTG